MSIAPARVAPAKGVRFTLPGQRFAERDGQPRVLTVTSVRGETAYFVDPLWGGQRFKIAVSRFLERAEVVSVPEPVAKVSGPRLSPAQCEALHRRAHAAGMDAGRAAKPTPIHVTERVNPWDDDSPVKFDYGVYAEGVCGFAWIWMPATNSFARWALKAGVFKRRAEGGCALWVRGFNQSYERKSAYAAAYAAVLVEAGFQATADGRLD